MLTLYKKKSNTTSICGGHNFENNRGRSHIDILIKTTYNTIQYNTIQYNTIQHNTIQYNTIQYDNNIQHTNTKLKAIPSQESWIIFLRLSGLRFIPFSSTPWSFENPSPGCKSMLALLSPRNSLAKFFSMMESHGRYLWRVRIFLGWEKWHMYWWYPVQLSCFGVQECNGFVKIMICGHLLFFITRLTLKNTYHK